MALSKKRSRDESVNVPPQKHPQIRRTATVYDAVEGKVGYESFLRPSTSTRGRDTTTTSRPVAPEEVLFRQKNAPTRYEETDPYFANRQLPPDALPDSDLLKHIHAYASDFYANATRNHGRRDWASMDETALLAMGILLEETAKEFVGETGDLAFIEGEGAERKVGARPWWNGSRWTRSVIQRRSRRRKKRDEDEEKVTEADHDDEGVDA